MKPFEHAVASSANYTGQTGRVCVYDWIGEKEEGYYVRGAQVAEAINWLASLDFVKRIELRINTPGGSVMDGMVIMAAVASCGKPVDTYCDGVAASMGAILMQCGRKRYMADAGLMMLHGPQMPKSDDGDVGEKYPFLSMFKASMATILTQRTGLSSEVVDGFLADTEQWFDSSGALEANLVDELYSLAGMPTDAVGGKRREPVAAYERFQQVLNSQSNSNPSNKQTMKKWEQVAASLKLPADSSEDTVAQAVAVLVENHAKVSADLTNTTNQLTEAQRRVQELETAQADAAVEQLISQAISDGRLAETSAEPFKVMAKANFEAAKAAIEALPVNKSAKHVQLQNGGTVSTGADFKPIPAAAAAAVAMAEIQAKTNKV